MSVTFSSTEILMPHLIWSQVTDEFPFLSKALMQIHVLLPGASGGERNHKAVKGVHNKVRLRLSKNKIEVQSAICYNGAVLKRKDIMQRDIVDETIFKQSTLLNIVDKVSDRD